MSQTNNSVIIPKYAWAILFVVYFAFFASGLMVNKVAPLVPNIMEAFSVSMSDTGLLMSAFGLTGLILALPAGIIIQRLGLKITGTIALVLITVGAVLGAVSGSFGFLLFSRILEGIGVALLIVVAPAAIAMWFPPEKSGAPMGIWSTASPISCFIIMSLAPILEPSMGWRGVWWLSAGVTFVALVVYWLLIRPAPAFEVTEGNFPGEPPPVVPPPLGRAFANKNLWLLSLAMLAFIAPMISLITYYPTFLSTERGLPMSQGGMLAGMIGLIAIPVGPLAGWLSDTIGSRKRVILAGFVIYLPVFALAFQVSGGLITVMAILLGVVVGIIPTVAFAATSEALNDVKLAGIGMAVLALGMNLGVLVGPPIFGGLIESVGWANTAYIFMSFIMLGIVSMGMYKKSLS